MQPHSTPRRNPCRFTRLSICLQIHTGGNFSKVNRFFLSSVSQRIIRVGTLARIKFWRGCSLDACSLLVEGLLHSSEEDRNPRGRYNSLNKERRTKCYGPHISRSTANSANYLGQLEQYHPILETNWMSTWGLLGTCPWACQIYYNTSTYAMLAPLASTSNFAELLLPRKCSGKSCLSQGQLICPPHSYPCTKPLAGGANLWLLFVSWACLGLSMSFFDLLGLCWNNKVSKGKQSQSQPWGAWGRKNKS